jgi:hypothetical protein
VVIFHRAPMSGQHYASDEATGLSFVVTRIDPSVTGRGVEYEIEICEPNGRLRHAYEFFRFDVAKRQCERIVDDRRTGADR